MTNNKKSKKKIIILATSIVWAPISLAIFASAINLIRYGSISKPMELRTTHNQTLVEDNYVKVNADQNRQADKETSATSNELSYIKVKITGTDGKEYYLDKGLLKDKISFNQDIYVDVCNTSQDSKFTGTVFFNGASMLEQYGTLEILPGQSQQLKVVFNKDDLSYVLDGEMIEIVDKGSLDKYKVLGSKTKNTNSGQAVYCGIEIPDDFTLDNGEQILKDFISSYSREMTVEMLIIYVYEKGYIMSNTEDMYKDSIYELDAYIEKDGSYSFDCYEVK